VLEVAENYGRLRLSGFGSQPGAAVPHARFDRHVIIPRIARNPGFCPLRSRWHRG